jgi:hypothetical protein
MTDTGCVGAVVWFLVDVVGQSEWHDSACSHTPSPQHGMTTNGLHCFGEPWHRYLVQPLSAGQSASDAHASCWHGCVSVIVVLLQTLAQTLDILPLLHDDQPEHDHGFAHDVWFEQSGAQRVHAPSTASFSQVALNPSPQVLIEPAHSDCSISGALFS